MAWLIPRCPCIPQETSGVESGLRECQGASGSVDGVGEMPSGGCEELGIGG